MITRRRLSLAGGAVWFTAQTPAWGQATARRRRVGSLSIASRSATALFYDAFKDGMRERGWLEGQNVEYRFLFADGQVERLDVLAGELLAQNVDVIVVGPPQAARALQKATATVPIMMANVSNAVGNQFVASLARPGGNINGITAQNEVVLGKLIEPLHQATPGARRIAILLNESNPSHRAFWGAAENACRVLKLTPLRVVANSPNQLDAAMAQALREQAQAIVVVADAMFLTERARLAALVRTARLPAAYGVREHNVLNSPLQYNLRAHIFQLAASAKLPAIYQWPDAAREGGLMAYGPSLDAMKRQLAGYASRILAGARVADLPIEQPTRFELVINLQTAKALRLTIPQSLLLRADEVVQ